MRFSTISLVAWSVFDSKIARLAQDIIRDIFWSVAKVLMDLIQSILNSLINGVLSLDVFTNSDFVSSTFKFSLALMFLLIPMRIIYEIVSAMIRDDDAGLDVNKKIGSAVFGIMIACSLTVGVTKVINPLVQDTTKALVQVNLVNSDGTTTEKAQFGDTLIETVLVSFGSMSTDGDYGAKSLVEKYQDDDFSIKERYESDEKDEETGEVTHKKNSYKWDFSEFMSIVGFALYLILLIVITVQIGQRTIAILFYYLIGPICCASLTNYQNPQAFNVWKNSIIGQWLMNTSQIFLLTIMVSIIDAISQATEGMPVASCCLYFGALSLVISVPNFVQAMIGGYSAGVMETLNALKGGARTGIAPVVGAKNALKSFGNSKVGEGLKKGAKVVGAGMLVRGANAIDKGTEKLKNGASSLLNKNGANGTGVNSDVFGKGEGNNDMSRQGAGNVASMGENAKQNIDDMSRKDSGSVSAMGSSTGVGTDGENKKVNTITQKAPTTLGNRKSVNASTTSVKTPQANKSNPTVKLNSITQKAPSTVATGNHSTNTIQQPKVNKNSLGNR